VARAFDAHLEFLHVRVDTAAMAAAMAMDGSGAAMIGGLVERIEEEADQREEKAKELFRRFCECERLAVTDRPVGHAVLSAQWLRQVGDEAYWVTEYARSADLLVIGRPTDGQGVALDTTETALLGGGRPLLIPPASGLATLPQTVVIAWKPAPEAARAITAAMPLLSHAKQVLIVTVAEERRVSEDEAARLMASLVWHGLDVSIRHLQPDPRGAAHTLLAAAAEQGALVVMGAYGHSRLREWIFGGFTQQVLRDAEVPVLMMH
jgi:nucleotide-binding universal stress UspA family protein